MTTAKLVAGASGYSFKEWKGSFYPAEMKPDGMLAYYAARLPVYQYGLEKGVLLRPLGNVVYLMPPYVITPEEIVTMCQTAIEGIDAATSDA